MAQAQQRRDSDASDLSVDLATYCVLDGRPILCGCLHLPGGNGPAVQLAVRSRDNGQTVWQQELRIAADATQSCFEIPVGALPGGYCVVAAVDARGRRCETNLVLREDRPGPGGELPRRVDYLAEARAVVDRVLAEQTRRLEDRPDGTPFVTVGRRSGVGYRSLGHRTGATFQTYWFSEEPFEYETFRADHDLWPVLDELSRLTGDPRYQAMTDAMLDALAAPGFDPCSGLLHFSEESDFDVRRAQPHSRRLASDPPRFKPINGGPRTDMHIERFWQRLPRQTHRWLRATYYGLVTDPATMDFNRFCLYGFDDRAQAPTQTPNSGHCGFETAAASLILFWASCWAYAADAECLEWARNMTRKWAAVQDPATGLVPNFFGAGVWAPGAAQSPGEWAESRCAAMAAPLWLRAAALLRRRPGAESLAGQLEDMGRRLALGAARHSYDATRRMFHEHLHLDGRPYEATARYCFRTQAEKDEAVRLDPQMEQVAVFDGAGLYRPANYYEHCAGSNIPYSLAEAAALCRDPELIQRLASMLADAVDEAGKLNGAFTPEGRWTFRASGWYVQACVELCRLTGNDLHLGQARQLADREAAALATVRTPHWWRLCDRAVWLDALLALAEAVRRR